MHRLARRVLTESLRAFGYELPTAIADLVDNAIAAQAKTVWIDFHWAGAASVIVVTDDGKGMDSDELVSAMRLGSRNPLDERELTDLGRFGLGLKTASFSQCRCLSVRTRKLDNDLVTRCWDLDHIARTDDWQLLRGTNEAAETNMHRLVALSHGTSVVWQHLDRVTGHTVIDDEAHHQAFLGQAEKVRQHLGMVFHELMAGASPVEIVLNDHPIKPWDPFLLNEPATQILAVTRLSLRNSIVEVQPFVLPHQSKISRATLDAAAGPHGWVTHEGFYVYRSKRLLVAGDWLGFGWAKEEHYKLARIRIDVPNSLDHDWKIDVTKSRAVPPPQLREELRRLALARELKPSASIRIGAQNLSHRRTLIEYFIWEPVSRHDKTFYRLNREHPLYKRALASSSDRRVRRSLHATCRRDGSTSSYHNR